MLRSAQILIGAVFKGGVMVESDNGLAGNNMGKLSRYKEEFNKNPVGTILCAIFAATMLSSLAYVACSTWNVTGLDESDDGEKESLVLESSPNPSP